MTSTIEPWADSIIFSKIIFILSTIMQVLAYDGEFLPRVSAQNQRGRRHQRRASWCCGVPILPILRTDGISGKSFSYDKLPDQPFKLHIRKLDGSAFDVELAKTATVAELKQAVEGVFSHMPKEGPGKISWSHVWGGFCLCYDGWKLLADSEPISKFGINDGDELHFIRHVSINYNLVRRRSKDRLSALDHPWISDDQENSLHQHCDDGDEDVIRRYKLKLAHLFRRCFSYRRLGSPERRFRSNSFSSRLADGFLGSFRCMVRLCSSKEVNSQTDPLEEV